MAAVEAAQQRGLSAARRTDECNHFAIIDPKTDILERVLRTIPEIHVPNVDLEAVVDIVKRAETEMYLEIDELVRIELHLAPINWHDQHSLSRGQAH